VKVITLICESFNRYDTTDVVIPGFKKLDFNLFPADKSQTALYLLETDTMPGNEILDDEKKLEIWKKKLKFSHARDFICDYVKTRMISYFWRPRHMRPSMDYGVVDDTVEYSNPFHMLKLDGSAEPDSKNFKILKDFIEHEFYTSDFQHLIYWPLVGHLYFRMEGENSGVPYSLEKTFKHWIQTLEDHILPLIKMDETLVMIHNDHGTRRKGKPFWPMINDGFLYIHDPLDRVNCDWEVTWTDIRKTLCDNFGINVLENEGGRSLCGG
jgi:hypothetical protein